MANRTYLAFAKKADEEGYHQRLNSLEPLLLLKLFMHLIISNEWVELELPWTT